MKIHALIKPVEN